MLKEEVVRKTHWVIDFLALVVMDSRASFSVMEPVPKTDESVKWSKVIAMWKFVPANEEEVGERSREGPDAEAGLPSPALVEACCDMVNECCNMEGCDVIGWK